MRRPRLRLTVRWGMVLVAVAGLIFWSVTLRRRAVAYSELAARHDHWRVIYVGLIAQYDEPPQSIPTVSWSGRCGPRRSRSPT